MNCRRRWRGSPGVESKGYKQRCNEEARDDQPPPSDDLPAIIRHIQSLTMPMTLSKPSATAQQRTFFNLRGKFSKPSIDKRAPHHWCSDSYSTLVPSETSTLNEFDLDACIAADMTESQAPRYAQTLEDDNMAWSKPTRRDEPKKRSPKHKRGTARDAGYAQNLDAENTSW
ncbi:hypothetical protein PENSPDRAFT_234195 [Peniophora sp. CONT]|nr:hypothetical protein PENSPDRAFT_234195 [Peniophora sp. CONT]